MDNRANATRVIKTDYAVARAKKAERDEQRKLKAERSGHTGCNVAKGIPQEGSNVESPVKANPLPAVFSLKAAKRISTKTNVENSVTIADTKSPVKKSLKRKFDNEEHQAPSKKPKSPQKTERVMTRKAKTQEHQASTEALRVNRPEQNLARKRKLEKPKTDRFIASKRLKQYGELSAMDNSSQKVAHTVHKLADPVDKIVAAIPPPKSESSKKAPLVGNAQKRKREDAEAPKNAKKVPKGLWNTDNKCFMVSTMQCYLRPLAPLFESEACTQRDLLEECGISPEELSQTDGTRKSKQKAAIARRVKRNLRRIPLDDFKLNQYVGRLFADLKDDSIGPIASPLLLSQACGRLNTEMSGSEQQDPDEFIHLLMPRLLREEPVSQAGNTVGENSIGSLLRGELAKQITCDSCGHKRDLQTEKFWTLPITINGESPMTFKECLRRSMTSDVEDMTCEKCNEKGATIQEYLNKAPAYLTVKLNRACGHQSRNGTFTEMKKGTKVDVPTGTVDLTVSSGGTLLGDKQASGYELYAFITHIGSRMASGHYIAYVLSDGLWNEIDDHVVTPMRRADVDTTVDGATPYLYFLKRSASV